MTLKTFNKTGNQNFAVAGNWTPTGIPGSTDDAEIASGALVVSSAPEFVNSISLGAGNSLSISSVFSVEDGTGSSANNGIIGVFQVSLTDYSGTFDNPGTIELTGDKASDLASFVSAGSVVLDGGGSVEMSIGGGPAANGIVGLNFPNSTFTLTNINDTISGDGTIGTGVEFTNDGTIETNNSTSSKGGTLAIQLDETFNYGTFINNGTVRADNGGTLILGGDGYSELIDNEAVVSVINSGAQATKLEIAGKLTISGSAHAGFIDLAGSDAQTGDEIVSDGHAATLTLINQTLKGAGVVGDSDLTINNVSGTIEANISGETPRAWRSPCRAPEISNGGTLEATNGGILEDLFAAVDNTGTITASGGGIVLFGQAVSGSGAIDIGAGGVVEFVSTIAGNVTFTGSNATLIVGNAGIGGQILGAAVSDSIDAGLIAFAASEHAVWQQTSSSGGTLSLYNNGLDLASFNLAGQFNSLDFNVNAGIGFGTNITIQNTPAYPSNPGNNDEWILSDGQWEASAGPGSHPSGYNVAGIGDWTGDGTDGILWFNPSTGDTDEWQLSNTQWSASVDLGTPSRATIRSLASAISSATAATTCCGPTRPAAACRPTSGSWPPTANGWRASAPAPIRPATPSPAPAIGPATAPMAFSGTMHQPATPTSGSLPTANGQRSVDLGTHPGYWLADAPASAISSTTAATMFCGPTPCRRPGADRHLGIGIQRPVDRQREPRHAPGRLSGRRRRRFHRHRDERHPLAKLDDRRH